MTIITDYGSLKANLTRYEFHQRFVPDYDLATRLFEAAANRRLRVLPMETRTTLELSNDGVFILPEDEGPDSSILGYLLWRAVEWVPFGATAFTDYVPLDYVHPAYLKTSGIDGGNPQLFTIEGSRGRIQPVPAVADTLINLHYYGKIPSIVGSQNNGDQADNWLISEHPDCYLAGVLTELHVLARNAEQAQLQKARRDECFAEIIQLYALTTGATSSKVRESAEFF
jgi:hypothetical protein